MDEETLGRKTKIGSHSPRGRKRISAKFCSLGHRLLPQIFRYEQKFLTPD
jgi:hypothetical protein